MNKNQNAKSQEFEPYELEILQNNRLILEQEKNIRFINFVAYIDYLSQQIQKKINKGEFVPRSQEEAQAGYYLF